MQTAEPSKVGDLRTVSVKRFLELMTENSNYRDILRKGHNYLDFLDKPFILLDAGGRTVEIPARSELVLYQDPHNAVVSRRIGCIHAPDASMQVVIWPREVIMVNKLSDRTFFGRKPLRAPRLQTEE